MNGPFHYVYNPWEASIWDSTVVPVLKHECLILLQLKQSLGTKWLKKKSEHITKYIVQSLQRKLTQWSGCWTSEILVWTGITGHKQFTFYLNYEIFPIWNEMKRYSCAFLCSRAQISMGFLNPSGTLSNFQDWKLRCFSVLIEQN